MRRGFGTAVAGVLCALLAAAPSQSAERHEALTLSPSRAVGTAGQGVTVGPFELTNTTQDPFAVSASPVLLEQRRDGAIGPRTDAASRRRANRLLDVGGPPAPLPPGGHLAFRGRLLRGSAARGFYGGILVRAEPVGRDRQSIRSAFQLNASLFLRPAAARRRLDLRPAGMGAEQEGSELRLTAAVANAGNVDVPLTGELRVRREGGDRVLLRRRLRLPMLLPGATVALPALTGSVRLPAGRYEMVANLHGGAEDVRTTGRFTLHGTNALATRRGRLVSAQADGATQGERLRVSGEWDNRGNVPFAPRVVAEVRRLGSQGAGAAGPPAELPAAEAAPGRRGVIEGELPALGDGDYEVTLRLLDGRRELDRRSFSVSPMRSLGLGARLRGWIAAHPLVLPAGLLVVLAGSVGHFARRQRRLQARLAVAERRLDGD